MKQNKIIAFVLIFASILLFDSCKSKKIIGGGENALIENKTHSQIIEDVLNAETEFRTIYTKGNVKIGSKKLPAVYKMVKDEVIQVSVRMPIIGSEVARMTMTSDSIIILDRMHKQYVAENFKNSSLTKGFDFNFYNLQALLTNKLFVPGVKEIAKSQYSKLEIGTTDNMYLLQAKDKSGTQCVFSTDASNRIQWTLIANEKKNIAMKWTYRDFIKDGSNIYPTLMEAVVGINKKEIGLEVSYNKLEINGEVSIDNSISSKYKKVSFKELVENFIKLE
ncbi:DUF4292 domain-containing protein [Dysgonomonas sp. 511]|uniref:DUF4292 domain-containing protein n=1 Tax=Dysgonomonas sp. 511 TaxID=2302930 RepID=UPI0013D65603|nr:DUF4292 domain-containing protein [Dysgonomonas sp. 511]NDV79279.1 DUF4292 domain-containing protein [Dysgonomonas sp. 511]